MMRVAGRRARLFPDAPEAERHACLPSAATDGAGVTLADPVARGDPARRIETPQLLSGRPGEPDAARIARTAAAGDPAAIRAMLAVLADKAAPAQGARLRPGEVEALSRGCAEARGLLSAALAARG